MENPYETPDERNEEAVTNETPIRGSGILGGAISFVVLWGILIVIAMVSFGGDMSPWIGIPLHLLLPIVSLAIVFWSYRKG